MIDLNHVNHQLSSIQDTSEFEHVGSMIPGVEKYGIVSLQTSTSWRAIIGGLDMTQHYSPVILTCKMEHDHSGIHQKNKILYKQSILHFLHCYVTMSVYRNVPGIVHVLFILTLFLHPLPSSKDPSISLYPPNIPFSPGSPVFFFWSLNVHPQHVLEAFLCSSKSIRICCFSLIFTELGPSSRSSCWSTVGRLLHQDKRPRNRHGRSTMQQCAKVAITLWMSFSWLLWYCEAHLCTGSFWAMGQNKQTKPTTRSLATLSHHTPCFDHVRLNHAVTVWPQSEIFLPEKHSRPPT